MILGGAEGSSGTGVVPLVGAIRRIITEGLIDEIGTGIVAMGPYHGMPNCRRVEG